MTLKTVLKIVTGLIITQILISCGGEKDSQTTTQTATTEITKTLSAGERAVSRWNALIEKNWATAYAYESPNYRKNYTQREFMNSFGQAVTWVAIKHLTTTPINPTLVDIQLELQFNYDMGGNLMKVPSNITERWQLINKEWWHIKK
ncbi:MAG: hypothetical protein KAG20_06305 [Cocleimonas sp.]|nr:hypothetical protein [Cocleimonas sp.]